jgi:hypothetical protein
MDVKEKPTDKNRSQTVRDNVPHTTSAHAWIALLAISAFSAGCAPATTAAPTAPANASAPAAAAAPPASAEAPPEDPEGHRNWNCTRACKLAVDCKSQTQYENADRCEFDCTSMAHDQNGRFLRGALAGAAFYTCLDKASNCDGVKKCDHLFDAPP